VFLHIGEDTMVRLREVIGIFDVPAVGNHAAMSFVLDATCVHSVEVVESGDIKSFILTDEKVYCSPISSTTLKRRAYQQE